MTKDWEQSTLRAVRKAQNIDVDVKLVSVEPEMGQASFLVPSNTRTDVEYQVDVHMASDKAVGFWCSCRVGFGGQAPVGRVGCWHAGKVAEFFYVSGAVKVDKEEGFVWKGSYELLV